MWRYPETNQGCASRAASNIPRWCDVKSRRSALLRLSLSPRCPQPLWDVLPPDSDSVSQLKLLSNLETTLRDHFLGISTKQETVMSEEKDSCFRQLRYAILPLCWAAETDNNPERCRLSGCTDRPPTNHCTEGIETFPRVGQSPVIEDCYHRNARRPGVWNHVVYSQKKKTLVITCHDRPLIEIFNHPFILISSQVKR